MGSNMPDREQFTLLNLSESEESVPDLDLVVPSRKPTKRKVRLKRKERSPAVNKAVKAERDGDACSNWGFLCCGVRDWRFLGTILAISVLSAFSYSVYLLNTKIQELQIRTIAVEDSSKTVPEVLQQVQSTLDRLQLNQNNISTTVEQLADKLADLETRVAKVGATPQGGSGDTQKADSRTDTLQEFQNRLADIYGKLAETQQDLQSTSNKTENNNITLQKLAKELNMLKYNEIKLNNDGGSYSSGITNLANTKDLIVNMTDHLDSLRSDLAKEAKDVTKLEQVVEEANRSNNITIKWLNSEFENLQAKFSQMEDDNRNVSTRVDNLASQLYQLDTQNVDAHKKMATNLDGLEKKVDEYHANAEGQTKQAGNEADMPGEIAAKSGPRDKRSTIST